MLEEQRKDLELTLEELKSIEKNLTTHLPNLERGTITVAEFRRMVS